MHVKPLLMCSIMIKQLYMDAVKVSVIYPLLGSHIDINTVENKYHPI